MDIATIRQSLTELIGKGALKGRSVLVKVGNGKEIATLSNFSITWGEIRFRFECTNGTVLNHVRFSEFCADAQRKFYAAITNVDKNLF